jgi:hypothetical protein
MFVRWQTYSSKARSPRQRALNDKHARQKAILVESVRVDGKPRHRHIAFLSSLSIDRRDELGATWWCGSISWGTASVLRTVTDYWRRSPRRWAAGR